MTQLEIWLILGGLLSIFMCPICITWYLEDKKSEEESKQLLDTKDSTFEGHTALNTSRPSTLVTLPED